MVIGVASVGWREGEEGEGASDSNEPLLHKLLHTQARLQITLART